MSRITILLLMIFISSNILSQQEMKDSSLHSHETIKYISYLSDGKIDQVIYYKPSPTLVWNKNKSTKAEAFFYGIKSPSSRWVEMGSKIDIKEISMEAFGNAAKDFNRYQYTYDEGGNLNHIMPNGFSDSAIYFYGAEQQVSSLKSQYNIVGRAGELVRIEIEIYNHSDSTILLSQAMNALSFSDQSIVFILKPRSINKLEFIINPISGFMRDKMTLYNDSFIIEYPIKCFGYDLCTEDLLKGNPLKITSNFHFKRIGAEALLTIYDIGRESVLFRIPLTNEKMEIDLKELGTGKYIFSLHDFKNDKKSYCNVEIE